MNKLVLMGGFPGSGKTTAITQACTQLIKKGKKAAVITNDQGRQQVDSAHIAHHQVPVKEVANGCFCCNYTQLDDHVQSLLTEYQPDIIFAESVGSCTDMVATLAKPFQQFRQELEVTIVVFADASLLLALMEGRASFIAGNVRYICRKQLEEADILVLNKIDLISPEQITVVDTNIQTEYPGKQIIHLDAHNDSGISNWLEQVMQFKRTTKLASLDIDYDLYADGEAQLAWLDKSIQITSQKPNAADIAVEIARAIQQAVKNEQLVTGHLKFIVESNQWQEKISYTTMDNHKEPVFDIPSSHYCRMLINARVQTAPAVLKKLVDVATRKVAALHDCSITTEQLASFKPGYPTPTHRIA